MRGSAFVKAESEPSERRYAGKNAHNRQHRTWSGSLLQNASKVWGYTSYSQRRLENMRVYSV
jgi:hypothetical protein